MGFYKTLNRYINKNVGPSLRVLKQTCQIDPRFWSFGAAVMRLNSPVMLLNAKVIPIFKIALHLKISQSILQNIYHDRVTSASTKMQLHLGRKAAVNSAQQQCRAVIEEEYHT